MANYIYSSEEHKKFMDEQYHKYRDIAAQLNKNYPDISQEEENKKKIKAKINEIIIITRQGLIDHTIANTYKTLPNSPMTVKQYYNKNNEKTVQETHDDNKKIKFAVEKNFSGTIIVNRLDDKGNILPDAFDILDYENGKPRFIMSSRKGETRLQQNFLKDFKQKCHDQKHLASTQIPGIKAFGVNKQDSSSNQPKTPIDLDDEEQPSTKKGKKGKKENTLPPTNIKLNVAKKFGQENSEKSIRRANSFPG